MSDIGMFFTILLWTGIGFCAGGGIGWTRRDKGKSFLFWKIDQKKGG